MKPNLKYVEIDGRGDDTNLLERILSVVGNLKKGEGLHLIKDFEPLPLYQMMKSKGYDKMVEKISDNEYHVWFFPVFQYLDMEMGKHLSVDNERVAKMLEIKEKVFRKELSPSEARELVNRTFTSVTPEEFAFGEQQMLNKGITNETMVEGMDDILDVFKDVLTSNDLDLPKGHPIRTYSEEADAIDRVLIAMENQLRKKFIKNEWMELYEKLSQINIHFSRKQHQLFSALERKGFDRPSKVMWTFDNRVRDAIKDAFNLLLEDKDMEFLKAQENVIFLVKDILGKERKVLYPTSLKLLSDEDFAEMRVSDDEIGYCLIPTPPPFGSHMPAPEVVSSTLNNSGALLTDLQALLEKHGLKQPSTAVSDEILDVSTGKLTLEQVNLIFKHLQVDLSYVDEHDIVKFYSDTKHRVFPRSAGVIGREVQNCHPRESVSTVEAIIEAFRKGEQDKAEFWIQSRGKFIYIIYNAVRDENGTFRGVLEMMQDVTHIRSLTGSRKLLSWDEEHQSAQENNSSDIHPGAIIAPLLKKHPYLKDFLISLNPNYSRLSNPVVFNTMGNIATLDMIAARGGYATEDFLDILRKEVKRVEGESNMDGDSNRK